MPCQHGAVRYAANLSILFPELPLLDRPTPAATEAATLGATILIEPVSGVPAYPLRTAAEIAKVVDVHYGRIGHVQIADAPGRHEPGTGHLDLKAWLHALDQRGYPGYVAAEYVPTGIGFDWMATL